jgi:hypothetical protein
MLLFLCGTGVDNWQLNNRFNFISDLDWFVCCCFMIFTSPHTDCLWDFKATLQSDIEQF